MSVEVIDKLKQKNNGKFALMDAEDVEMPGGTRVDAEINSLNGRVAEEERKSTEQSTQIGQVQNQTAQLETETGKKLEVAGTKQAGYVPKVGDDGKGVTWQPESGGGTTVYHTKEDGTRENYTEWDADTKLDKAGRSPAGEDRVYCVNGNGLNELLRISRLVSPYVAVQRDQYGNILVPDAVDGTTWEQFQKTSPAAGRNYVNDEIAKLPTKEILNTELAKKLDKVDTTGTGRVYSVDEQGNQHMLPVSDGATSDAVVKRTAKGYVKVPAPVEGETETDIAVPKSYIDAIVADLLDKISRIPKFERKPVDVLPEKGSVDVLYLLRNSDPVDPNNQYTEYIYLDSGVYEPIGKSDTDLTGYAKVVDVKALIDAHNTGSTSHSAQFAMYDKSTQVDEKIAKAVSDHNVSKMSHAAEFTRIENEIANIGRPQSLEIVGSIEEMVDTNKHYVLQSDGMIYQSKEVDDQPNFTNWVKEGPDYPGSGTRNRKTGMYDGQRLSGEGLPVLDEDTLSPTSVKISTTGCIKCKRGDVIRVDGIKLSNNLDKMQHVKLVALTGNKGLVRTLQLSEVLTLPSLSIRKGDVRNGITEFKFEPSFLYSYLVFSSPEVGANPIITVNEEITYGKKTMWVSTGQKYIQGNYDADIASLREKDAEQDVRIEKLESGVASIKAPGYWGDAIINTVSAVKKKQGEVLAANHEPYCFGWCSDAHIPRGGHAYVENIGAVAAKVMSACDIHRFIYTGDIYSATSETVTESDCLSAAAWLNQYLDPIPYEERHILEGNHDFIYNDGSASGYTTKIPYVKQAKRVFHPATANTNRIPGTQEAYWYEDDPKAKVRLICVWSGNSTVASPASGGIGEEQLAWLNSDALNLPTGWKAIIATHVPPSKRVGNGYSAYFKADYEPFRTVLRKHREQILTIFAGHVHCDFIYDGVNTIYPYGDTTGHTFPGDPDDLPIPIITITCSNGFAQYSYGPDDSNADLGATKKWTRSLGTDTETAMDFVVVDTTTGESWMYRCGSGDAVRHFPVV